MKDSSKLVMVHHEGLMIVNDYVSCLSTCQFGKVDMMFQMSLDWC
jgi:hypothetical protein